MADKTPHADSGFDDDPFDFYDAAPDRSNEAGTSRPWMLALGGAALLAFVVVIGVAVSSLLGGDDGAPADSDVNVAGVVTTMSATAAAGASSTPVASATSTATAAPATATPSAAALAEARANVARLEGQLRDAQNRADALERQVEANAQVLRITSDRVDSAQAELAAAAAERASFQADYDAIDGELTQANADRAALRIEVGSAQAEASAAQAKAAQSAAYASSLSASVDALHDCLAVHQQALYYTSLSDWGLVAAPMQDAALRCFEEAE